jgi:hypothetical protein
MNSKVKSRKKTAASTNGHRGPLFGYSSQSFSQQQQLQASTISSDAQIEIRERVRKMFFHGYKSYIDHAFPMVSSSSLFYIMYYLFLLDVNYLLLLILYRVS